MTIILDPIKHTGAAPEPIVLLAEAEQLTFTGAELTDNMAATILSPTGTALASGLIAGNAVTLDTRTSQAWDYISAQACGVTAPALLAIGDATALVAVLPIRVLRNNLYNLTPPSETVTVYPSMAQLQEILARIAAAEANLETLIEQAQSIDANIGEVVRQFQASVTAAETLINQTVTTGVADINTAKTGALNEIDSAKQQAEAQLTGLVDQAADAKAAAEAAQAAAEAAETAVETLKAATDSNAAATSADALTSAEAAEKAVEAEVNAKASADAAEAAKETLGAAASSAETARDEAVAAKDAAEAAQTAAATAAGNAATSAAEAEAAAEEIAGVAPLAENSVQKTAGTTYLNWHEKTYTQDNTLGSFTFYPAPVGFLLRQQMRNPYGAFYLYWMKPNGERVLLHTAQDAWLKSSVAWRFGWVDGNSAKVAVYVSASQSAIVEVPFIDGVVQAPSVTLVAGGSLPYESTCATAKKLTNGHILTSVGRVYNSSTLELTATITLKYRRIVSATDGGGGVFATLSDAVYRLDDDENGAIVQTKTTTTATGLALSNGHAVEALLASANFAVIGGRTQPGYLYFFTNESIRLPVFIDIDLGAFLLSPYGIFYMTCCGNSSDSIAYPQAQILSREAINSEIGPPVVSGDGSVAVWNTVNYTIYSAEEMV